MDGLPVWGRPYPVVIETFGAAALLLAIIQWAWRPLRPWVRHHAPLLAGLLAVGALWDLITLKLNWMVLPYFPGPAQVLAGMIDDRGLRRFVVEGDLAFADLAEHMGRAAVGRIALIVGRQYLGAAGHAVFDQ